MCLPLARNRIQTGRVALSPGMWGLTLVRSLAVKTLEQR